MWFLMVMVKVNIDLYSAYLRRSGVDNTVLPANTQHLPLPRSLPEGATTEWSTNGLNFKLCMWRACGGAGRALCLCVFSFRNTFCIDVNSMPTYSPTAELGTSMMKSVLGIFMCFIAYHGYTCSTRCIWICENNFLWMRGRLTPVAHNVIKHAWIKIKTTFSCDYS